MCIDWQKDCPPTPTPVLLKQPIVHKQMTWRPSWQMNGRTTVSLVLKEREVPCILKWRTATKFFERCHNRWPAKIVNEVGLSNVSLLLETQTTLSMNALAADLLQGPITDDDCPSLRRNRRRESTSLLTLLILWSHSFEDTGCLFKLPSNFNECCPIFNS